MARQLRNISVRHHAVLNSEPDEELVTAMIGPAGETIAVWAPAADLPALTAGITQPEGARFPSFRSPYPVRVRVATYSPKLTTQTWIQTQLAHILAQPLPDGRALLVSARAVWRPDGPDLNAVIYNDAGRIENEMTFGDGINHVQSTTSGRVWVGYFDEGVFGNFGWGQGAAPPPIGRSGLVRFSPEHGPEPDWHFPGARPGGSIDDCYALNVDGETAWAYYYSNFPVVRVHEGSVDGWLTDGIDGACALAASGKRVALFGGYRPRGDRLTVGQLDNRNLHVEGQFKLVLPDEQRLPSSRLVAGRGPDLHLICGQQWFRIGLDDVM